MSRSVLRRVAILATACALLAPGFVSFALVTRQAPAFNETLLIEGVTGGTRRNVMASMYDRGAYLFQTGFGYLTADALMPADPANPGDPVPFEVAAERRERAAAYFEESLRLDPANANVWLTYAQSIATVANPQAAGRALTISARLAPSTLPLAVQRLHLVKTLRDWSERPDAYAEMFAADTHVVASNAPDLLERLGIALPAPEG